MTFLQSFLSGRFVRDMVSFGTYEALRDVLGGESRVTVRHELEDGYVPEGLD